MFWCQWSACYWQYLYSAATKPCIPVPVVNMVLAVFVYCCHQALMLYQAFFKHVKVSVTPFYLTKTLIYFVFDMLAVLFKTFPEIYCQYAFIDTS